MHDALLSPVCPARKAAAGDRLYYPHIHFPITRVAPGRRSYHHHVYVVELDPLVLNERRFREANPGRDVAKACLYVGSTGLSPDVRFDNHKRGYKGNRYVKKYGLRLRPDLYEYFNPMPYAAALELEVELARGLREEGYAVWQG